MAARKRLSHDDKTKRLIQASQLINRLNDHALCQNDVKMDKTQISAANILLRKVLPDLAVTQLVGDHNNPIQHRLKIEFVKAGE